jgi:hypothetical protein
MGMRLFLSHAPGIALAHGPTLFLKIWMGGKKHRGLFPICLPEEGGLPTAVLQAYSSAGLIVVKRN